MISDITHAEPKPSMSKSGKRLQAFDKLAGSVSMDMIDNEDPRTQYLLNAAYGGNTKKESHAKSQSR